MVHANFALISSFSKQPLPGIVNLPVILCWHSANPVVSGLLMFFPAQPSNPATKLATHFFLPAPHGSFTAAGKLGSRSVTTSSAKL